MEESLASVEFYRSILNEFNVEEKDIRTYSPLTLAYIGDSIYDLVIRSIVVGQGNTRAGMLHAHTSSIVNAHSQSEAMRFIYPELSHEEADIYRRGRNAKSPTMAKNASMGDYRRATGFEALMGYLYITGQSDRMMKLIKMGLEGIDSLDLIKR